MRLGNFECLCLSVHRDSIILRSGAHFVNLLSKHSLSLPLPFIYSLLLFSQQLYDLPGSPHISFPQISHHVRGATKAPSSSKVFDPAREDDILSCKVGLIMFSNTLSGSPLIRHQGSEEIPEVTQYKLMDRLC